MRILVAVDLGVSSHDVLLSRTDRFARLVGGTVDIAYVRRADASLADIDNYETRLRSLMSMIEPTRQGYTRLEVGGDVDEALVQASAGYDLVVVGPREPGALERLLKGVMSVRVIRRAHSPVLVPRGDQPYAEQPRMVVGVDIAGSVQTMLVEQAGAWAQLLGARVDLVYAVAERIPTIREANVAEKAEREWLLRHDVEMQSLRALMSHLPAAQRGDALLKRGEPEDVLVALSGNYDLAIVGNRDRPGLAGLILGAVARPVVRHARCDVLALNTAAIEVS